MIKKALHFILLFSIIATSMIDTGYASQTVSPNFKTWHSVGSTEMAASALQERMVIGFHAWAFRHLPARLAKWMGVAHSPISSTPILELLILGTVCLVGWANGTSISELLAFGTIAVAATLHVPDSPQDSTPSGVYSSSIAYMRRTTYAALELSPAHRQLMAQVKNEPWSEETRPAWEALLGEGIPLLDFHDRLNAAIALSHVPDIPKSVVYAKFITLLGQTKYASLELAPAHRQFLEIVKNEPWSEETRPAWEALLGEGIPLLDFHDRLNAAIALSHVPDIPKSVVYAKFIALLGQTKYASLELAPAHRQFLEIVKNEPWSEETRPAWEALLGEGIPLLDFHDRLNAAIALSRVPDVPKSFVYARFIALMGQAKYPSLELEPAHRQFLNVVLTQWRDRISHEGSPEDHFLEGRILLTLGLLRPTESDQFQHDLAQMRDEGFITAPQYNQYNAALSLKLQDQHVLPSYFHGIQIRYLGYVGKMPAHTIGNLKELHIVRETSPTTFIGIEDVVPAHLSFVDNPKETLLNKRFWIFDEKAQRPFMNTGRMFVPLGIAMDGSAALYQDVASGMVFTLCIWLSVTQSAYKKDVRDILKTSYEDAIRNGNHAAAVLAVRTHLEALADDEAVQEVLRDNMDWISQIDAADRIAIAQPISKMYQLLRAGEDPLERVRRELSTIQNDHPSLAKAYFGTDKTQTLYWVEPLKIHFTETGRAWLGHLLGVPADRVIWELGALKMLYDSRVLINPSPVFRALSALKESKVLSFEDVGKSHYMAFRESIVPALNQTMSLDEKDYRFRIGIEKNGARQDILIDPAQIGQPLLPFLESQLGFSPENGIKVGDYFVSTADLPDYRILPGDTYTLLGPIAGGRGHYSAEQSMLLGSIFKQLKVGVGLPGIVLESKTLQRLLDLPESLKTTTVQALLRVQHDVAEAIVSALRQHAFPRSNSIQTAA